MTRRSIFILILITVVLLVFALYPVLRGYLGIENERGRFTEIDLSNFSMAGVDKIRISKGEDEKLLTKRDTGWQINDLPASLPEIESFFKKIADTRVDNIVSRNRENRNQFGVDDQDGYKLELYQGDVLKMSLIIGKQGSDISKSYFRKDGSDNVYSAYSEIRRYVARSVNDWRDKIMVNILRQDVHRIELVYPDSQMTIIQKGDNKWVYLDNEKKEADIKDSIMDSLFAGLSPLRASGFVEKEDEIKKFNSTEAKTVLKIFDSNDKQSAELDLLQNAGMWWATVKGKEFIYTVPDYNLKSILIKKDNLHS